MIPVDQTVFTVPGGNCFSACLASLLEIPLSAVPYFMGDFADTEDWFPRLLDWLRPRGWWAIPIPLNNEWKPEGLCILSGKSPRGEFLHSVVAHGLDVVHDPHPSRAGVLSKDDVVVIVPLDPAPSRPTGRQVRAELPTVPEGGEPNLIDSLIAVHDELKADGEHFDPDAWFSEVAGPWCSVCHQPIKLGEPMVSCGERISHHDCADMLSAADAAFSLIVQGKP